MNFRRAIRRDDELEINLIPLIDVLLVILIFLAATTSFTHVSRLKVDLPQAQADPASMEDYIDVAVSQDGLYAVGGRLVQGRETVDLAAALRTALDEGAKSALLVNADALSTHESVVRVLEAARMAGVRHVNFAAQAKP